MYKWLINNQPMQEPHMGTFMFGVHKRNVLPQNHFQNTILNDRYIYKIIYLVDFFFIK
jgi:hypothetical protein